MKRIPLHPIALSQLKDLDSLLQSGFWGAFKALQAWTARAFLWEWEGERRPLLVLERKVGKIMPLAYLPHGPLLPEELDAGERSNLLDALALELQGELSLGCFFIRFDLTSGTGGVLGQPEAERHPEPLHRPLQRAPYRVQPPDTVVLNLKNDDQTLLADMHKKTRYNIGLAERRGVEPQRLQGKDAENALPEWYALYRSTARRDGIALHNEPYYHRLFQLAREYEGPTPTLSLHLAHHEGELLGGIITAVHGCRATYLYGASADHKRELMPNHLLQWRAIQDARAAGAQEYDLFGIPPTDDPDHPMHGLWRFKTGFGGRIVHNLGSWDRPYSRLFYILYRGAESLKGRAAASRKKPFRRN